MPEGSEGLPGSPHVLIRDHIGDAGNSASEQAPPITAHAVAALSADDVARMLGDVLTEESPAS